MYDITLCKIVKLFGSEETKNQDKAFSPEKNAPQAEANDLC